MSLQVLLAFKGTDMSDPDTIYVHTLVRGGPGMTPSVKGRDDPIPGADGFFARNRRKERRIIEGRGIVVGEGATEADAVADYWDNRVALETLMDPTATGTLQATLPNGEVYTITARPLPMDGPNELSLMSAEIAPMWETIADADWEPESSSS